MRYLALVATCAALAAFGEEPADFSASAAVTPSNGDALQRFTLPLQAYRDTRRDLADVRVFNANGEPVPIALAGDPDAVREAPRIVALPLFPVSRLGTDPHSGPPPRGREHSAEVTVRMSDGTLVEVRGRGAKAAKQAVPVAYLVDASRLEERLAALVVDWNAAPGTEVVRVSVEASDDLQSWRNVGHASLVRLTQGGRVLEQPRVALAWPTKARYYRVTWSGAPELRVRSVRGEYEGDVRQAKRESTTVAGRAGGKPGEFVFDLGARLPVEALRIVPVEPNSVAQFAILARDPPSAEWSRVTTAVFYRLERNGTEVESPPVEVGRYPAREWMARVDPRVGGIGATPPKLEVQWRSRQVVFVARGPGPFRLAFGDPDAKASWVGVATLIPDYRRGDELKLPEATVGPVEGGPPRRLSFLPGRVAEMGPRKLALWAVLILAVAVLGFMAWRLHRQMRAK